MSAMRSRWAAIGAAVAISLGAGGLGVAVATISSGERAVYVPITPCRLADTRPAPNTVGPRTAPVGPAETYVLNGWGTVGNCTLPNNTAGLALNVTALNATQATNLRFFPAGATLPTASNLNPTPGQPPVPNAVNVDLRASDGRFSVYNAFGNVNVVIDVVGYYEDHNHDDLYYRKSQVNNLVFDGTIPSGVTVTGNFIWDSHGSTSTASDRVNVDFPGRAPVALTNDKVNFDQPNVLGDGDPQCNGTPTAPTAPPGKVCLYYVNSGGMAKNQIEGRAGFPLDDAGFRVVFFPDGSDNADQFLYASWAYTAP